MTADSESDIKSLRAIGRICAETLRKMMQAVRPGITTGELDEIGRGLLESQGARSAPQLAYRFPGATCISVSPVIAHGIPGDYALREGDLIHIDVSAELGGYFADTGASLWVSRRTPEVHTVRAANAGGTPVRHLPRTAGRLAPAGSRPERGAGDGKLLEVTQATLGKALRVARAGRPLNEIGKTVQREAKKRGYNVIRELTGHGIGRSLHEEPGEIWNFFNPRDPRVLKNGMVLAVGPFLTTGQGRIAEESDGWSLRTADRAAAAQFEHTIIVTQDEPIILTL